MFQSNGSITTVLSGDTDADDTEMVPLTLPFASGGEKRGTSTVTAAASPHNHGLSTRQRGIICAGQVLSFLVAAEGAAATTLHFNCSLSLPAFSLGMIYLSLAILCLLPMYKQTKRQQDAMVVDHGADAWKAVYKSTKYSFFGIPIQSSKWSYGLIAIFDVYASYFSVLALKYTTITSVCLFETLSIPTAMSLSAFFLAREYSSIHYIGVILCLMGVVVNVASDYKADLEATTDASMTSDPYPNKVLGDALGIIGGIFWGLSALAGEVAVQAGDAREYLGMMGFFGTIISFSQAWVSERHDIVELFSSEQGGARTCRREEAVSLIFAYVFASVVAYIGTAFFLKVADATLYSMSLLTGDFWALAYLIVAQGLTPQPLFFVALCMKVTGFVAYETAPHPTSNLLHRDDSKTDSESSASTTTTTKPIVVVLGESDDAAPSPSKFEIARA